MPPRTRRAKQADHSLEAARNEESDNPVAPRLLRQKATRPANSKIPPPLPDAPPLRRSQRIAQLKEASKDSITSSVLPITSAQRSRRVIFDRQEHTSTRVAENPQRQNIQKQPRRNKAVKGTSADIGSEKQNTSPQKRDLFKANAREPATKSRTNLIDKKIRSKNPGVKQSISKPTESVIVQTVEDPQDLAILDGKVAESSKSQVASWVTQLPPDQSRPDISPDIISEFSSHLSGDFPDSMASRSGTSLLSPSPSFQSQQGLGEAKAKSETGQDASKLAYQLQLRNADPRPERVLDDPLTKELKQLLNIYEAVCLPLERTKPLKKLLRQFLRKLETAGPSQDMRTDLQEFQDEMNAWKPANKQFTLTDKDLEYDRNYSLRHNEAVLQRTVLTSMIDRWRLNDMFEFTCEQLWSRASSSIPLPGPKPITEKGAEKTKDKLGGLKPDLAIYFRWEIFSGVRFSRDVYVPNQYQPCAFPDGNTNRCFPFVFVEAKKGEKDLTYAAYCNVFNASQALWNMYLWMDGGEQKQAFFDKVRVFSITLNARRFCVRVHRAIVEPMGSSSEGDALQFVFDDLYDINNYTQHQASLLVRNLLLEYGVARLRDPLITAFSKIVKKPMPSLRQIDQVWAVPEIRDAIERAEQRALKEVAEKEAGDGALNAEQSGSSHSTPRPAHSRGRASNQEAFDYHTEVSPKQAESSKRAAPKTRSSKSKRPKQSNRDSDVTHSFDLDDE